MEFCTNCGYALWPSVDAASRAFKIWRDYDPDRRGAARPFDTELPGAGEAPVVDFEARAHDLGIHVFPSSPWPFTICLGLFFLFLALIPFATGARIVLGVIGGATFLVGIAGWVWFEDSLIYPADDGGPAEAAH